MKKINLKLVGTVLCSLITLSSFSQFWRQGGNGAFPPGWNVSNPLNQRLGTTTNFPLRVITNGIQRMHINSDNGSTNGFIGIGENFNSPQALVHINNNSATETWLQITNSDNATGLRLGTINENIFGYVQSAGYLRWHPRTPFIIQTGGPNSNNVDINQLERLRISSLGNPNPDPFNISGNITRIGISEDGADHIEVIRSLLHLGYNTGAALNNNSLNDGWRNWMDIGTFTNNGRENMYVGLKQENPGISSLVPLASSHFDAVINWGDNEEVPTSGNFTNLRFIYTIPHPGNTSLPQASWDGLEVMRIEPTVASTLSSPNFGMVGIGNFSDGSLNAGTLDAKLDIDGDLRIREVTENTANDLDRVLVIDPNDHNRVHWRNASSIGGGGTGGNVNANNGLSISPNNPNPVQLGQEYNGTTPTFSGIGELTHHTEIPLNGKKLIFSGLDVNDKDEVAIGSSNAGIGSSSKFNVHHIATDQTIAAINGYSDGTQNTSSNTYGVVGAASGGENFSVGVMGIARDNNDINYGVRGVASGASSFNYAFLGQCLSIGIINYGALINSSGGVNKNYGIEINSTGQSSSTTQTFGIKVTTKTGTDVYGIYSYTPPSYGINAWAGYFHGNVGINGTLSTSSGGVSSLSDQQFKQNVTNLSNASKILNQLQPRTYNLDATNYSQFNFDTKQHMGFIAQEVQSILPDLVSNTIMPAQYDSLGNETSPQVDYLSLNYQEFIPLLVAGYQEQQQELNTKDSVIENLQTQINEIRNCLNNANICKGEGNRTTSQNPTIDVNERSIQLVNSNSIILDQNLPNPFAENTVITYSIPDDVMEARLMFYNMNGRIIKEMIIEERGESKLTVYGENLKSGVYTYSLIADGKLIATKKMVKQ